MSACIQISHLSKRYGSTVAVDDLSLDIETGEVIGLLGPNGAGKSTTLYMLSGLVAPTSGSISIFGRDFRRSFLSIAARMGVLTERPAFYDHLSVRKNLQILAALSGREVPVDRALDRVGLLSVAGRKAGTLSAGMRQRLGIAQALMTEPELLLLDEPTSGLDPEATQGVLRLLRRLASEAKVTVVFSSHMLNEVEAVCDRVAILNGGRLVTCDALESLVAYDTNHLDVLVDAPESAARRLKEQHWVTAVQPVAGRVEVRLAHGGTPHQLITFLIGAGFRISGVIPRRRTLQEYFLKVLNL